jgi:hypothetical protein
MSIDTFISWLIESDCYLLGGCVLLLGIAVLASFTNVTGSMLKFRNFKSDDISQAP